MDNTKLINDFEEAISATVKKNIIAGSIPASDNKRPQAHNEPTIFGRMDKIRLDIEGLGVYVARENARILDEIKALEEVWEGLTHDITVQIGSRPW